MSPGTLLIKSMIITVMFFLIFTRSTVFIQRGVYFRSWVVYFIPRPGHSIVESY